MSRKEKQFLRSELKVIKMDGDIDFLAGDAAHKVVRRAHLDSVSAPLEPSDTSETRFVHDLPERIEFLETDAVVKSMAVDRVLETFELDEACDISGSDPLRYVGDGKNVYQLRREDGFEDMPDRVDDVHVSCIGVCDPDTYSDIVESEGFDGVLDYMDGIHQDATGYDSKEEEFVYPEGDLGSNASEETVEQALKDYERINSD